MLRQNDLTISREFRCGARTSDENASVERAVRLIKLMCRRLGLRDLSETTVLDMGCGGKFTQAFINHRLPIQKYVGIDVDGEMIDWLNNNVDDARFEFHHMNIHNLRYSPKGIKLSNSSELPVVKRSFDVICLFSVFTHLEPGDFRTMLEVLRKYIKDNGRLFFTLFLDEASKEGKGLADGLVRGLSKEELRAGSGQTRDFHDVHPDRPLEWALYSRDYSVRMIEEAGWHIIRLDPPETGIQHHITCRLA